MTHDALLQEIEEFLVARDMKPGAFGFYAVNDGKLVARLRGGASVTLKTAAKIKTFMAEKTTTSEARAS